MEDDAQQREIAFLREQLQACADGITESKYLQQAKKARDLSVKLDSEKARVAKLQATIIKHERETAEIKEAEKRGVLLPTSKGGAAGGGAGGQQSAAAMEAAYNAEQVAQLKQKLDKSASQSASLRAQCDKHERELARAKKVLLAELGDEAAVEKALGGGAAGEDAGYRGRAQQISLLQSKVKDLSRKLNESMSMCGGDDGTETGISMAAPSRVGGATTLTHATATSSRAVTDYDSVHRSVISQQAGKKHAEMQQLQQQLDESREAAQKEKQRADALSARVHALERQTGQLRTSLGQVIAKTENDDQLVEAYKTEIEAQRAEIRSLMQKNQQQELHSARGGGGGGGVSATASPSSDAMIQRLRSDVKAQEAEIQTLRRHIATSSDGAASDGSSTVVIDNQRRMILSLEEKLQAAENSGGHHRATALPVDAAQRNMLQSLRDENASLKDRLSAMSSMMERELALRTAQMQQQQQQQQKPPAASASSSAPPARGAALGASSASSSSVTSSSSAAAPPARSSRPAVAVIPKKSQQQLDHDDSYAERNAARRLHDDDDDDDDNHVDERGGSPVHAMPLSLRGLQ